MSKKPYPIFLTLLAAVAGYVATYQCTRNTTWSVDLEVEVGGILKWYIDSGSGFSEQEGAYGPVSPDVRQIVEIDLPTGTPERLRLDPVNTESIIAIHGISWREPWPGSRGRLDPQSAVWENVESAALQEGQGFVLEPVEESMDVYGVWGDSPAHSAGWWFLVRLGGAAIVGAVAFVLGLLWNRKVLQIAGRGGIEEKDRPPFAL